MSDKWYGGRAKEHSAYLDTIRLHMYIYHYLEYLIPVGRWIGGGLKAVDKNGNSVTALIKEDFMNYVDEYFDRCIVEDRADLYTWLDAKQKSIPYYKLASLRRRLKWWHRFLRLRPRT